MSFKSKFANFPLLETERLSLRELNQQDAAEFQIINSDLEVQRYMATGEGSKSVEEVEKWINTCHARFNLRSAYIWAITLKENNKAIGYIEYTNFVKSTMVDIAYYLSKDYWNQGIMSEAIKEVAKFGFTFVGFHRIQALVAVENLASIKCLTKAGFTNEGILRQYILGKEIRDVSIISMLKTDCNY